mgnify:CR=1 FL=1
MAALIGIQIVGTLFSIFMMYYMFLHFKRKEFTAKEFIFWIVFWGSFIMLILFPQILDPLLIQVGIARALDFFIIVGFLFLISISIYTYTIVRKNQRKVEEIVREIAMRKK